MSIGLHDLSEWTHPSARIWIADPKVDRFSKSVSLTKNKRESRLRQRSISEGDPTSRSVAIPPSTATKLQKERTRAEANIPTWGSLEPALPRPRRASKAKPALPICMPTPLQEPAVERQQTWQNAWKTFAKTARILGKPSKFDRATPQMMTKRSTDCQSRIRCVMVVA